MLPWGRAFGGASCLGIWRVGSFEIGLRTEGSRVDLAREIGMGDRALFWRRIRGGRSKD